MCSPYFTHSKANKQENLPMVITTQWYRQDQEQDVSDTLHFSEPKKWQPSPRRIILIVLSDSSLQNPRRGMQENYKAFFFFFN